MIDHLGILERPSAVWGAAALKVGHFGHRLLCRRGPAPAGSGCRGRAATKIGDGGFPSHAPRPARAFMPPPPAPGSFLPADRSRTRFARKSGTSDRAEPVGWYLDPDARMVLWWRDGARTSRREPSRANSRSLHGSVTRPIRLHLNGCQLI